MVTSQMSENEWETNKQAYKPKKTNFNTIWNDLINAFDDFAPSYNDLTYL